MPLAELDLSDFFPPDLAIPVAGPDGSEFMGIFTDDSIDEPMGSPRLMVAAEDVVRLDINHNSRISLERPATGVRTTYVVHGRQFDGTGLADLVLETL